MLKKAAIARLSALPYYGANVARSVNQNCLYEVQSHQLLVAQKQETRHSQNRIEKVLQMVQGTHETQGRQKVILHHLQEEGVGKLSGFPWREEWENRGFPRMLTWCRAHTKHKEDKK